MLKLGFSLSKSKVKMERVVISIDENLCVIGILNIHYFVRRCNEFLIEFLQVHAFFISNTFSSSVSVILNFFISWAQILRVTQCIQTSFYRYTFITMAYLSDLFHIIIFIFTIISHAISLKSGVAKKELLI